MHASVKALLDLGSLTGRPNSCLVSNRYGLKERETARIRLLPSIFRLRRSATVSYQLRLSTPVRTTPPRPDNKPVVTPTSPNL